MTLHLPSWQHVAKGALLSILLALVTCPLCAAEHITLASRRLYFQSAGDGGRLPLERANSFDGTSRFPIASAHRPFIVRQFFDDFAYLSSQPDFYALVGGLSVAPVAFHHAFDTESPEVAEDWGSSLGAERFFESGEVVGQAVVPVSCFGVMWVTGKVAHSTSLESAGADFLRAQFTNGILTLAMKAAIGRRRPNGAPYSYPSGHTSVSFATAGVVYGRYGPYWGIPAFVAASYVGLSRLQENKHYITDVIAGAILGGYVGIKLTRRSSAIRSLSVTPASIEGNPGLALALRF